MTRLKTVLRIAQSVLQSFPTTAIPMNLAMTLQQTFAEFGVDGETLEEQVVNADELVQKTDSERRAVQVKFEERFGTGS